jgi:hypothetical protein
LLKCITKLETRTKLSKWIKIDGSGWAWEGHLLGGGEEVRDVLESGGMVGVTVYYVTKYPSFVHRNPVFKLDWIWFSRKMIIQSWEKLEKLQTNGGH